jgi:hypothetical protein
MLPEIEVPKHLVDLRQALTDADSDNAYIRSMYRVYSDTAARRVEWDIKVKIAEQRHERAAAAYGIALKKYLKEKMS